MWKKKKNAESWEKLGVAQTLNETKNSTKIRMSK